MVSKTISNMKLCQSSIKRYSVDYIGGSREGVAGTDSVLRTRWTNPK